VRPVSKKFLRARAAKATQQGYEVQKWIIFCNYLIFIGFSLFMYESKSTVSKYIYVRRGGRELKIRFSNHKPNYHKEDTGDCDFFVGVTHKGKTNYKDALNFVINTLDPEEVPL